MPGRRPSPQRSKQMREMELALRESEERYRLLYDQNPSMYFTVDPAGTVLSVNQFGAEYLGYTVAELRGQSVSKVFHEEDRAAAQEYLQTCLAEPGAVHQWELRKVRKNGSQLWVKETARGVSIPGRAPFILIVCEDITIAGRTERALHHMVQGTLVAVGEDFFRTMVHHLADALSVRFAFVAKLVPADRKRVQILALWDGERCVEGIEFDLEGTPCEKVFEHGHAHYPSGVRALFQRPDFLQEKKAEGYSGIALYDRSGQAIGHIGVIHDDAIPDDAPVEPVLRILAARAADELERKRTEASLEQYQHQLRSLASKISLVEERERRRIAAELHDRTIQTLALARIKLGALRQSIGAEPLSGDLGSVGEVLALVDQTIRDARSLVFELSPPVLYELGFEPAMEWLAERVQEEHQLPCEVRLDSNPLPLSKDLRIVLFQSVRELLANVSKHAKASRVEIGLEHTDGQVRISVTDDGVGLEAGTLERGVTEHGGFGLFSIGERLHLVGGQLSIDSAPDAGTRVTLTVPLDAAAES